MWPLFQILQRHNAFVGKCKLPFVTCIFPRQTLNVRRNNRALSAICGKNDFYQRKRQQISDTADKKRDGRPVRTSNLTSRNYVSGSLLPVSEFRRYGQLPLFAHAHIHQSLVPAFNNLADSQLECERLISVQAVTGNKRDRFKYRSNGNPRFDGIVAFHQRLILNWSPLWFFYFSYN